MRIITSRHVERWLRDDTRMTGWPCLVVREAASGRLLQKIRVHNLDTQAGKNLMRDLYLGNSQAVPSHIALGTNATPATVDDVALYDERVRVLIASRVPAEGQATIRAHYGKAVGNGATYQECGMFTPDNILVARATFPAIAKTASVTITVNWIKTWL